MIKVWLVAIMGLLVTGCAGEVPYSAILIEDPPAIEATPADETAATIQAQPDPVEPTTEAAVEEVATPDPSESSSPAPPELPGVQLFNFVAGEPRWFALDDSVMGGISSSSPAIMEPDLLAFSGTMSLDNNGGFASVRSEWQPVDLGETDGILLRVYGDGQTYRLRIQTAATGRDISYNALFDTTPNEWQIVYIPFAQMVPTYFGYVADVGAIDRASIGSFGFMLSDNQPGEFELFVDWVRAVSEQELQALGG